MTRTIRSLGRVMLLGAALVLPVAVSAETVFLRNGQYVTGELVGQTLSTISLRTSTGRVQVIPKSKIRRILYTTTSEEQKRDLEEKARAAAAQRAAEKLAREKAEKARREKDAVAREQAEKERKRQAEEATRRKEAQAGFLESPLGRAVFRSALLPGWGQRFQGRTWIGDIYTGASIGFGVLAWYFYKDYQPKRKTYESESQVSLGLALLSPDLIVGPTAAYGYRRALDARNRMRLSGNRANVFWTGFALTWAWNMVDVVLFRPGEGAAVFVAPSDGLQVGFRILF